MVMKTSHRWRARFSDAYRSAGHTGAPLAVLYALVDAPKGLTQSELCERMELSGPSLTRLVDRLELDGLVSRRRLIGDGRARLVVMEPEGRVALKRFDDQAARLRDQLFEGVSEIDMAAALRVLDVVAARLAADQARTGDPKTEMEDA